MKIGQWIQVGSYWGRVEGATFKVYGSKRAAASNLVGSFSRQDAAVLKAVQQIACSSTVRIGRNRFNLSAVSPTSLKVGCTTLSNYQVNQLANAITAR